MKRFLAALLLAALATLPAHAQQPPVTVGAALPMSGNLADLAAEYRKALLLWQDEVNARGGLLGRHVELLLVDDRSESIETGKLYEQMIQEKRPELLLGPFGTAASLGALNAAERSRRVLINATGAGRVSQKPGFRYIFQTVAPLGAWGTGALELARAQNLKRVALFARDDPVAREMASRARDEARAMGFEVAEVEAYSAATDDFSAQVRKAAGAEAWIAFGLPQDAAGMVKSFRKLGYAPKLFVAQGAADGDFIRRVGQDAEGAVGILAYDRRARTKGNAEFVRDYAQKWSADPGAVAAEGYAAAKVLEEAVKRAGSLEQEKLRDTLAALETETPLGAYKVDRAGAQLAAKPLLVQVQRGRREIVWPEALATAKLLPYAGWDARTPLKK
jgi:branched-chain amino acid transport system substrate-binding protein